MKHAARPDRSGLAAFLVFFLTGIAVLGWVYARPTAEAAPGSAPAAAAPGTSAGQSAPTAEAVAAKGSIEPVRISIPAIGVDAPVESRGTVQYENAFTGKTVEGYGVPESMGNTSWWSDGPEPGSGAMAVVLGHAKVGGPAVFNDLDELRAGDRLALTADDGSVLSLDVLGEPVTGLDKATSALSDALNGHPDGADLALVTCSGEFDADVGASEDNTVVFATVVRG